MTEKHLMLVLNSYPYLIKDIKALESIQRHFTKRLPGMEKLTYHLRISILELDSLELRADLLFTYKLVFGLIDANLYDLFIPRFNKSRRGHYYKLYLPTCKSNIRSNSFNYRVIQKWNSLSSSTDFTSLKRFHKSLSSELLLPFPYCKVFLSSCSCLRMDSFMCFVFYIHVHVV